MAHPAKGSKILGGEEWTTQEPMEQWPIDRRCGIAVRFNDMTSVRFASRWYAFVHVSGSESSCSSSASPSSSPPAPPTFAAIAWSGEGSSRSREVNGGVFVRRDLCRLVLLRCGNAAAPASASEFGGELTDWSDALLVGIRGACFVVFVGLMVVPPCSGSDCASGGVELVSEALSILCGNALAVMAASALRRSAACAISISTRCTSRPMRR